MGTLSVEGDPHSNPNKFYRVNQGNSAQEQRDVRSKLQRIVDESDWQVRLTVPQFFWALTAHAETLFHPLRTMACCVIPDRGYVLVVGKNSEADALKLAEKMAREDAAANGHTGARPETKKQRKQRKKMEKAARRAAVAEAESRIDPDEIRQSVLDGLGQTAEHVGADVITEAFADARQDPHAFAEMLAQMVGQIIKDRAREEGRRITAEDFAIAAAIGESILDTVLGNAGNAEDTTRSPAPQSVRGSRSQDKHDDRHDDTARDPDEPGRICNP